MADQEKCLILYDGVCHLCNWWVRFLIRSDKNDRLRFAALQHVPDGFLPESVRALSDQSVVVYFNHRFQSKSDAVVTIIKLLPSPWRYFSVLRFIPRFIRDWLYSGVAKTRYRVFGKHEACPMIPKEWLHKFAVEF